MEGRWHLANLWESVTVGEGVEGGAEENRGRFLSDPFCRTTLPLGLDLFTLWTPRGLCGALDAVSFTWTSSSWSAVRGSWPLQTAVLVFEGAFPQPLRG